MPTAKISKQEVVDIALQEFLQNGVKSFTIKQLTEITGISTKTVYKLFEDKADLLRICLKVHYSRLATNLLEVATDNEIETILNIIHHVVNLEFNVNPRFYTELNMYYPKLQDEAIEVEDKIFNLLTDALQRGVQNGMFLPEFNLDVYLITCKHLYLGITRETIYSPLNLSGPELVKNTILVYLRGMCTPSGLLKMKHYEKSI